MGSNLAAPLVQVQSLGRDDFGQVAWMAAEERAEYFFASFRVTFVLDIDLRSALHFNGSKKEGSCLINQHSKAPYKIANCYRMFTKGGFK
jgi:hypothetical protein